MNHIAGTSAQHPPAVVEAIGRIQQMLLAAKYEYAAGDPEIWPATPVLMVRESDLLIVEAWGRPEQASAAADAWRAAWGQNKKNTGLLLVGVDAPDDPHVRWFFEATKGTVAYIDAEGGRFRLRRGRGVGGNTLRPLTEHNLRKLIDPAAGQKNAQIDCPAILRRQLEEKRQTAAFLERSAKTGNYSRPLCTCALLAVIVAAFLAMVVSAKTTKALASPSNELVLRWGALYGPLVRAGQWWRIATCSLVHIGVVHLLFNGIALLIFGPQLEMYEGRWRLALLFVFSVVCGSLARLAWNPMVISAGASGGLFGLIGALLAVVVRYRRDLPKTLSKAYVKWLVTILLYNAAFLFHPGIDGVAHVGGFIGGLAMGLILSRSPVKVEWPRVWTWFALAALAVATCAFGRYAVARIDPNAPVRPSDEREHEDVKLYELWQLRADADVAGMEFIDLDVIYRLWELGAYTDDEAAMMLREDVLPRLPEEEEVADLLARAQELSTEEVDLRSTLEEFLKARAELCQALLRAMEGRGPREEAIQAGGRYKSARARAESAFDQLGQ